MNTHFIVQPELDLCDANLDGLERIEVQRRQALLSAEVQHRAQNTLAVVQSLARMSFAGLPREIVAPFEQRLVALAGVHNLLVQTAWEGADLQRILERVSDALNVRSRIDIRGPPIGVTPTAAVFYGLAFHELCANAIKHGALSSSDGRLDVSWRLVEPDGHKFHLVWREHDGPLVAAPTREGFGSRLLKRALAAQLGASVTIQYLEDGLVCEFGGPVQRDPLSMIDVGLSAHR
jgi:two-component sensor histidine kinase